jgi:protein TonB
MQAIAQFRNEERLGLLFALIAHGLVLGALALQAMRAPAVVEVPDRIAVSLAEEVALEAAAPELATEAAAAAAPTLAEKPRPAPPQVDKPRERVRPTPAPTSRAATPRPTRTPAPPVEQGGGTRLGENFLGEGSGTRDENAPVPAAEIGRSERASLVQAISRQLRPYWDAPNGLDAEKLVTLVTWRLNQDGGIAGSPTCSATQGITDSNRTQAARHCELAIRAIRRAAPFELPPKYYEAWKLVRDFRFDGTI